MPSRAIVIIDKKPFVKVGKDEVECAASIVEDFLGSRLELQFKLCEHTIGTPVSSYIEIETRLEQKSAVASTKSQTNFAIVLTRYAFVADGEGRLVKCLKSVSQIQHDFQSFPDTLAQISSMRNPILLEYAGVAGTLWAPNFSSEGLEWAGKLRTELALSNKLTIIVDADTYFDNILRRVKPTLDGGKADPLAMFYERGRQANKVQFDLLSFSTEAFSKQSRIYRARNQFSGLTEYLTIQLAASTLDRARTVEKITKLEEEWKKLVLVQYQPSQKDKLVDMFYGLMTMPRGDEYPLKTGDAFDVHFDGLESRLWHATVIDTNLVRRDGMLSLLVRRPRAAMTVHAEPSFQPSTIYANKLSPDEVEGVVRRTTWSQAKIKYRDQQGPFTNFKTACQAIYDAQDNSAYLQRVAKIVQGRQYVNASTQNLWHPMKGTLPETGRAFDPTAFMEELNNGQRKAVGMCDSLVHGLGLIIGPPGTGKTYLIVQILSLFLLSSKRTVALLSAPTNKCVDDLARGLAYRLHTLQKRYQHFTGLHTRYILRVHAKETERSIFKCAMRQHRAEAAHDQTQIVSEEADVEILSDMFSKLVASNTTKYEGVQDRRVQEIRHSVGVRMRIIAQSDPTRWARLVQLTAKFDEPKVSLNASEQDQLEREMDLLYDKAMKNATAIVGTTTGLASQGIMHLIKDDVAVIVADEAASEREDALLTLLGQEYKQSPCVLLVGDPNQLHPRCDVKDGGNPLWPQLEKSLMSRLLDLHHNSVMLTTQYRMCPDISKVPNALYYRNKLDDDPSTFVECRPLAMKFQEYARNKLALDGINRFVIDIGNDRTQNITRRKPPTKSKSNQYFVCANANLLEELLRLYGEKGTIALITSHDAQRQHWQNVLGMMRKIKLPHLDKLTIDTIDSNQGREYDIVVVELLVDESPGFLQYPERMNVAVTRARIGLIVVCDVQKMYAAVRNVETSARYEDRVHTLKDLMDMFKGRIWKRPSEGGFPKCKYYTPEL